MSLITIFNKKIKATINSKGAELFSLHDGKREYVFASFEELLNNINHQ